MLQLSCESNLVEMMSHTFETFLDSHLLQQQKAVKYYHHQGQKVWLKKASKRHASWIYLPLRWSAQILGLKMLAPVPNTGGTDAIQCEIQRIQTLSRLNIQTPEILATREDAFLMRDAAQNGQRVEQLERALKQQKTTETRMALYQRAIHAIQDIHVKKAYLSEAFARNILVDDQHQFSFIDFETDPGQVLSLKDCQTRDWLCFIFSTARCFDAHEIKQATVLISNALHHNVDTFQDICRVGDKLKWLLKFKPEKLGKDGTRLRKAILMLCHLQEKKPLPMI